ASVTERRTEIGIRRALGARQRDIQFQFLAESSLLCVLGGLIGAALGIGATLIISAVVGWTWLFSAGAVGLGVATAIVVGLVFGYFPARQAARLDPIAALRDT
ncbi:MAG: FtsX-like permease family protein, partial [Gammaproteobacteria bacterium]|nr:FtsX-like permease family protein [Gammaproteobacteria bacterium]